MESFTLHTGTLAPLDMENVDTDQIIPAIFLRTIEKEGMEKHLFHNLKKDPNFILNKEEYKNASILISGKNFGCGSSREHAPWALIQHGFKAIIAESFADIFKNNSFKNGLLLIPLKEEEIRSLMEKSKNNPQTNITIDLINQTVSVENETTYSFEVDPFRKTCLLKGVDDLGYIRSFEDKIIEYEEQTPIKGIHDRA